MLVEELQFVLSRRRFAIPLFGALQMIGHLGPLVLVHGASGELAEVPAAFDFGEGPSGAVAAQKRAPALRCLADVEGTPHADLVGKVSGGHALGAGERRHWALLNAYFAYQEPALSWFLSQGPAHPSDEPYIRHALARNGRMVEAVARLPTGPALRRRWLEAELHLNLFTEDGFAFAEPVYIELLEDSSFSDADRDRMRTQLEEVRTALRT